jgi:SAM-dependent methyltransferase
VTFSDANLEVWNQPSVVDHYAAAAWLQPCEAYCFDKYVNSGDTILDLGMGGGRTTPYLLAKASRYVGADYSQPMVEACRKKFPALEIYCEDASDLKRFDDASFDVVVFSFNGIDNIRTAEARGRCMREVNRVLRPGGRFIFSSHNAKGVCVWPILRDASAVQIAWRIFRSIGRSIILASRQLGREPFRTGMGYIRDPVHGGLITFVSTPERIASEAAAAGLRIVEVVDSLYPETVLRYFIPWYYYVLTKRGTGDDGL